MSQSEYYFLFFLVVPLLYVFSSFVLLRKPNWIHGKRRPAFVARAIGHRGGAAESIENSLEAFSHGLDVGLEMIEIDCYLTLDGQIVVHHDENLRRTTGRSALISETNFEDLPAIENPLKLYFDSKEKISIIDLSNIFTTFKKAPFLSLLLRKSPKRRSDHDELIFSFRIEEQKKILFDFKDNSVSVDVTDPIRIPLLREVFQKFPKVPINIDVKQNNDFLIQEISRLVEEFHRENITLWGSFSDDVCRKLDAQNKSIVRFCSLKEVAKIVVAYWLGFLPFLKISAVSGAFEIPISSETLKAFTKNLNCFYKFLIFIIDKLLSRRSLFVHLQRRGIPVYLWVLNDEKDFRRAFHDLSATGVMTDYPSRLRHYLDSNKNDFILH